MTLKNSDIILTNADEFTHRVGSASNWNESRYIDFYDGTNGVGGWFRIGNRPNEHHAEMSACIHLPDGKAGFMFSRPESQANGLSSAGQHWYIDDPWRLTRVTYHGEMIVLTDPWLLIDPKRAFNECHRAAVSIELECRGQGLDSILGADQRHIARIFLPGQADFHYQHLIHTTGRVALDSASWQVDGRGAKDHSWGARNWLSKIYFRWLVASFDDAHGFMLTRAVGPTKSTRSGFVWDDGQFRLIDDFEIVNDYAGAPDYELKRTRIGFVDGSREWQVEGLPRAWLPLRHRQKDPTGKFSLLRIVKSPTQWRTADGLVGWGMCEFHDLVIDGRPAGLHD